MEINNKDILTLDDNNEYVVVSKANYDNKIYYYLVDIANDKNIKFCYIYEDNLIEVSDNELITKLLPLFLKEWGL